MRIWQANGFEYYYPKKKKKPKEIEYVAPVLCGLCREVWARRPSLYTYELLHEAVALHAFTQTELILALGMSREKWREIWIGEAPLTVPFMFALERATATHLPVSLWRSPEEQRIEWWARVRGQYLGRRPTPPVGRDPRIRERQGRRPKMRRAVDPGWWKPTPLPRPWRRRGGRKPSRPASGARSASR